MLTPFHACPLNAIAKADHEANVDKKFIISTSNSDLQLDPYYAQHNTLVRGFHGIPIDTQLRSPMRSKPSLNVVDMKQKDTKGLGDVTSGRHETCKYNNKKVLWWLIKT